MQTTLTPPTPSLSGGATRVWDLTSTTQHRFTPRARPSRAGGIAAAVGAVALCLALIPAIPTDTRLLVAVVLGAVSVPVGFAALRRRRTRTRLVLAVIGLVAPLLAVAVVVTAIGAQAPTVTSSTVPRATLEPDSSGSVPTRDFHALATDEQAAMKTLLASTLLQIQTMHGSWAPLPSTLKISNGVLVEGDGLFRGATLGAVPGGERLAYQVADDGTAFRIAVSSSSDPAATIWADRALQIPANS